MKLLQKIDYAIYILYNMIEDLVQIVGCSSTAEMTLTIFATAEPTCHCNGQVKMLPRA